MVKEIQKLSTEREKGRGQDLKSMKSSSIRSKEQDRGERIGDDVTKMKLAYLELFEEGSLKRLPLVCELTGLKLSPDYRIDIEEWALTTVADQPDKCCKC